MKKLCNKKNLELFHCKVSIFGINRCDEKRSDDLIGQKVPKSDWKLNIGHTLVCCTYKKRGKSRLFICESISIHKAGAQESG